MTEETQPMATEAEPPTATEELKKAEAEEKTTETDEVAPRATPVPKKAETEEKKTEAEEVAPPADAAAATTVPQSASFKEESNVVADLVDRQKKALDELKQLVQAALSNNEFSPPPPAPAPAAPADVQPPVETDEKEGKPVEVVTAGSADEPKTLSEEPPKLPEPAPEVVEEPAAPVKEEALPPPPPASAGDEGGAKAVEAIEKTVVPVAGLPPAAEEAPPAAEEVAKEPSAEALATAPVAPPEEVKNVLAMLKDAVIWRKQFGVEALLKEDLGLPELDKVVYTHGVDKECHPVCYNIYGEFHNKQLYEKVFGDAEKRQRFLKWRIQYLEKGIRERLDFTPGGVSSMVQVTDLKNSPRLGKHRQVTKQAVTLLQDNYPEFIAKKVFINVPWWYLAVSRMMSPFFTQRTKSKFRENAENGYTVIVQKTRKLVADDEPVIRSSFKISEPGKVVLDIENLTSKKKKKLLYRYQGEEVHLKSCCLIGLFCLIT
ncbi:hypothetical protein OPV22_015168 [Ensete ventricosum]|uniref:CRAL-TRIO domain-containing protein n=1 Tax=Ensete ventricosum TaxID=4639 RepID=A0AAV8QZH7_ENSVE|nr:hypothetical protein OPV22_015168 [Ensete ventricosum]